MKIANKLEQKSGMSDAKLDIPDEDAAGKVIVHSGTRGNLRSTGRHQLSEGETEYFARDGFVTVGFQGLQGSGWSFLKNVYKSAGKVRTVSTVCFLVQRC